MDIIESLESEKSGNQYDNYGNLAVLEAELEFFFNTMSIKNDAHFCIQTTLNFGGIDYETGWHIDGDQYLSEPNL